MRDEELKEQQPTATTKASLWVDSDVTKLVLSRQPDGNLIMEVDAEKTRGRFLLDKEAMVLLRLRT